ncbi:MAG: sigma-70 family RNA polymerase sigma factor [Micrococcales bacterium]|nr:sigma-70 family RNA polymerase sigma factor [Micrococcales bacterium]
MPPSWDALVREHANRVYRLAYRLTGNVQDAEDLTQETFIRVFRSIAAFKPGTLEGWMHRITVNLFLDQVRHHGRLRIESYGDNIEDFFSRAAGPEPEFEYTNLDLDIQQALDTLPADYRAAVVLADIEGYTYDEIGVLLDTKVGTVASRIHRGRAQLRDLLAHRAPRRRLEPSDDATRPLAQVVLLTGGPAA